MIELKTYQKEAVDELRTGSILVGGVGTGKSIVSLTYFYTKVCDGKFDSKYFKKRTNDILLYVITTAQKRDNHEWEIEASHFLLELGKDIFIDSWNNIAKYIDVKNAFFIFDEQRLVGYGAWVKSFLKIAKHNDWILLSATPGDQWTDYIPVFVANGFYNNKTEFIRRHVVYKPFMNYPVIQKYLEEDLLYKLRNMITIKMNGETPAKRITINKFCKFDKNIYKKTLKNMYNYLDDRMIENDADLRIQLRRIVNSDASRLKILNDILKEHNSAIIFYNYNYELNLLKEYCNDNKIIFSQLNGKSHDPLPNTNKKWVYLVQYTAGAEGWNCIITDTVIFYSLNYSYRIMEQASGRIDRMNTKYLNLYYYYIKAPGSIDDAITKCLKQKKTFNEKRYFEKERNFMSYYERK